MSSKCNGLRLYCIQYIVLDYPPTTNTLLFLANKHNAVSYIVFIMYTTFRNSSDITDNVKSYDPITAISLFKHNIQVNGSF